MNLPAKLQVNLKDTGVVLVWYPCGMSVLMCILGAIFQCPFSTSEIEISECERISSLSSDYKGSFQNNFKKLTLIWRQLFLTKMSE